MKMIKNFLINVRRTKIWYNFLSFLLLPFYSFVWEFVINLHGKILYFFWISKKNEKFDLKKNSSLIVRDDLNYIDLANSINNFFPKEKIENIINNKKKNIDSKKKNIDFIDFNFEINDELSPKLKEKILNFSLSDKNLSTVANYLKVFPIISLISLQLNIPVDEKSERGSMLWHKDDFGFKSLDLFITISELNLNNGPLYFLKKYNPLGVFSKIEDIVINPRPGERNKVNIENFNKYYTDSDTDALMGKPGDALFIDSTRTYHRGGYCKSKNRLMLRITYQTPDSIRKSVLKEKFIKEDYAENKLKQNMFLNYAVFKKFNFFFTFINLKENLMFIYKNLHFKMNLKNIKNLF